LEYPEVDEVSLVGATVRCAEFTAFGMNADLRLTKGFGQVLAAGSGTDVLFDWIGAMDVEQFRGEGEQAQISFDKTLSIVTALFGREVSTGLDLDTCFGGGFEIAVVEQGKFRKIDDITHLFWTVTKSNMSSEMRFSLSPLMIKSKYVDDLLLIRRAKPAFTQSYSDHINASLSETSDQLHVVEPIDRSVSWNEVDGLEWPTLNSNIYCHYLVVESRRPSPEVLTVVRIGGETTGIKINERGMNVEVGIADELIRYFAETVRQHQN